GAERADLACVRVDPHVDVLVALGATPGGLDRLLDRADELLPGNLLLGIQLQECADEITTHCAPPTLLRPRPLNKKRGGHPRRKAAVRDRALSIHRPRPRSESRGDPAAARNGLAPAGWRRAG